MSSESPVTGTQLTVSNSNLGTTLQKLLMADEIQPGADPSYQLCKLIYLYHPLGAKMAEAPVTAAQQQERIITVGDSATPSDVVKAFTDEWETLKCDEYIADTHVLSRVFGITSLVLGCEDKPSDEPLDMWELWKLPVFFNVLDPLNTAGSLVLSQVPTAADFNKPRTVRTNNETYHRSRYRVVMNERPVYIAYTPSSFGYVGRSVYQRALFPLKTFINSMIADDMIQKKLGLLIAKQKAPGSFMDNVMSALAGFKRALLKQGQTGQVLSIGTEEEIETLNMQNVEKAGQYSRGNALKNAATAGGMPAVMLENETLAEGFGEGTEDAKTIAAFTGGFRKKMRSEYRWMENIVQYRAWNPDFFARMQREHPDLYAGRDYKEVFFEWRATYKAEWPSLLMEPDSELVKVEKVKFEAIVDALETILPHADPKSKVDLIVWAADEFGENKKLFAHRLVLDAPQLKSFLDEAYDREVEAHEKSLEQPNMIGMGEEVGGKKTVPFKKSAAKGLKTGTSH